MQTMAEAARLAGNGTGVANRIWQHRVLPLLAVLACAVPLLYPTIPPLTDLPGHIARYHVELTLDSSAALQRHYDFHWALTGNLGVDLLIIPMAKLFGLELGVKLIVIAIPMMLAAGFLGVARELHGHVPPTAYFALPLTYHHAFQFGFVNFSLSAALCFLAFWLWLHLGRMDRIRLRGALFVPISCLVWVSHVYGWGMLGILAFSAEVVRMRSRGDGWLRSLFFGGLHCLPLCPPFLLMLMWRSGDVRGFTGDWQWQAKATWLISILRERWQAWDVAGAVLSWLLVLSALAGIGLRMHPAARIAVLLLVPLYLAIPRVVIGSGYADMRLAAFIAAIGIIGSRLDEKALARLGTVVAAAGLLFFTARIVVTTAAFATLSAAWQSQLAALPSIERGSRVLLLSTLPCLKQWSSDRIDHLGSLALARRDAFTNSQWALAGAQLLRVKYGAGKPFVADPSHLMRPGHCGDGPARLRLAQTIAPHAFDYLWVVDLPRPQWQHGPELIPVWSGPTGILYRTSAER